MDTTVFIALMNPGMALVFSATFLVLWHHQRERRYVLWLGLAFIGLAVGFLFQYFVHPFGIRTARVISNGSFLAGALLLVRGCLGRYGLPVPVVPIALAAGAGVSAFLWFMFVQPDLTARIFVINFTFGALALILAAELRHMPRPRPTDRLLTGLFLLWGVTYFPRPLITYWIEGPYLSYDHFNQSLYWITMVFSGSLFLLLVPLLLITGIALDVIDELKMRSNTDLLSGLLNRRGFEESAADRLTGPGAAAAPAALVVADLDHFKHVNDSFGHAVGDRLIADFGARLAQMSSQGAVAGRIGGEEFAVLLPASDAATARLFAEGVRSALPGMETEGLPEGCAVSASFGVAEWMPGETLSSLLLRADRALYEAKEAGRNCVRIAPPAPGGRAEVRLHQR